ncbi:hypothetical protein X777_12279 [Ooceraea biroi]|uniref:YqaJ viral recombinase domain-containing protein n=1 Tax=Ooceraea biroi TaxID=2015173 RepID=A0A026W0I6_OOCBI|nr:hypothetical protein X777_12279 [Ooceraea biroi]
MRKNVPPVVANLERRRQIIVAQVKQYREVEGKQKRFNREAGPDSHYGPHLQKPDLPPHVFEQLQQHHAAKLLENANNRVEIECQTRGQSDCELWQSLRREMLTASNFGIVCRMRPTTSCAATVKSILFPPSIETVAMKYGRDMEDVAKKQIAAKLNKDIRPCGLFIDEENPCLGASPDGLIDEDGLLEIKCPLSAENLTTDEVVQKLPQLKTVFDKKNPDEMNQKHRFFYQVQGQLNITRRDYCIFVVWTPKSFKIVRVSRDESFWKNQMLPLLIRFYNESMLPEILDSRHNRHLPIRNPQYILEAMFLIVRSKKMIASLSVIRTTEN